MELCACWSTADVVVDMSTPTQPVVLELAMYRQACDTICWLTTSGLECRHACGCGQAGVCKMSDAAPIAAQESDVAVRLPLQAQKVLAQTIGLAPCPGYRYHGTCPLHSGR